VSSTHSCKRGKQLTFTQIHNNQFLIEGSADNIKIVGENEYSISYIDFENGPLIHIGHRFLGRGKIVGIELIDPVNPENIIVKITLENKDNV
jgi:hypothetical protein